jgi:tripartite-type tricarboxylate transporter receptor subunit TctC
MRNIIKLASALALGLASTTAAFAQYPEKPIIVINPNSAGGGTDVGIRTWQPYVERCLGEGASLVPTAMPGAASGVGIAALKAADADGYTIGMTNMPNLVSNSLSRPDAPTIDEFDYIGNIVGVRSTINVRADSQFQTWEEALEFIKNHDGPINVGMGGVGADDHLAGLQLEKAIDADFNFIPFGSGADARNALLGGQVEFGMMSNVESAGFREEIRPLAIAADERSELWPDTPTFKEKGLDIVGGSDHIISVRKGFPEEALAKWRECVQEAAQDPDFLEDAQTRNIALNVMTAEETETFVREQQELLQEIWNTEPWIQP